MTFPKICQRKFSCVNDVSIATVYSEVYFDYFLSFFSLFSGFLPSFVRRRSLLLLCACFDQVYFLEQNHIFFGDVIVSRMTAGLEFKMAASNSKWQACDVIVTSLHVISPIC